MIANDRRVTANRANAARSTGPRTKAGKAATRLNALRHGLAAALHHDPGVDREIEALARAIIGAEGGSELIALARRVADAEWALRLVRSAKKSLENPPPLLENPRADSSRVPGGSSRDRSQSAEELERDFEPCALDRYERRARSRRRFAIRDYDDARAALAARKRSIEDPQ
jgi:hypothetical protein